MTIYPFNLPAPARLHLPPPSRDGNCYVDVRFRGKWDGILVVNADGQCIGAYVGRQIREAPLPFEVDEIEDVRRASLSNRMLAALPIWWPEVTLFFVSPAMLGAAFAGVRSCAIFILIACPLAIRTMYSYGGFIMMRLPLAMMGVGSCIAALITLLRRH